MKSRLSDATKQLLETEDKQLKVLHSIVSDSLREEKLISHRMRKESKEKPNFGARLADRVAAFGGSWTFIIIFVSILVVWIALNGYFLVQKPFDPFPFILLNLGLSCIAALQAPIIMMSQNRQEAKDRKRAEHDYVINLKAELEIRSLHQKIDMLMVEQMKTLIETQKEQIAYLQHLAKHKE